MRVKVSVTMMFAVALAGGTFGENCGSHCAKPCDVRAGAELAPEKELAFRRRLETVHESGLRDATLMAKPDEFAFRDGSEIACAGEPSPYMRRAIADFADFMDVSMGLRLENVKFKMENKGSGTYPEWLSIIAGSVPGYRRVCPWVFFL